MVLSLNSIEHQVKQYGDKTYKFSFRKKVGNEVAFYKRIKREDLKEPTGATWMELMNNPDTEEHEQLNQLYKEDEPDRFKGVVKDRAPALNMSRRAPSPVVKPLDQDIIDELKRLLLKEQKGLTDEKEKLENLMNNNPRELEQAEKELDNQKDDKKDKDDNYTAEGSGSDTESDSDTSIQSEY
jgi:hypothetical protein